MKKIIVFFTLLYLGNTNCIAHEVEGDVSGYSPEIVFHVNKIPNNDTLSVRSGAGTHNKKIDELAHNVQGIQVVKCKELSPQNEWCKIHYETNHKHGTGWVSAKYLSSLEISKEYYDSGKLREITSQEGAFSKTTLYDESGVVRMVSNEAEGVLDGPTKFFYKSGTLMLSEQWDSESPLGVSKLYFESGALQMTIHFDDESGEALYAYIYKEDGTKKKVVNKDKLAMVIDWFYDKRADFWNTMED